MQNKWFQILTALHCCKNYLSPAGSGSNWSPVCHLFEYFVDEILTLKIIWNIWNKNNIHKCISNLSYRITVKNPNLYRWNKICLSFVSFSMRSTSSFVINGLHHVAGDNFSFFCKLTALLATIWTTVVMTLDFDLYSLSTCHFFSITFKYDTKF